MKAPGPASPSRKPCPPIRCRTFAATARLDRPAAFPRSSVTPPKPLTARVAGKPSVCLQRGARAENSNRCREIADLPVALSSRRPLSPRSSPSNRCASDEGLGLWSRPVSLYVRYHTVRRRFCRDLPGRLGIFCATLQEIGSRGNAVHANVPGDAASAISRWSNGVLGAALTASTKKTTQESQREANAWEAFFWVNDVMALHSEFKSKGAVIVYGPLIQESYQMKEFAVRDCDGHVLGFGQPLETVAE